MSKKTRKITVITSILFTVLALTMLGVFAYTHFGSNSDPGKLNEQSNMKIVDNKRVDDPEQNFDKSQHLPPQADPGEVKNRVMECVAQTKIDADQTKLLSGCYMFYDIHLQPIFDANKVDQLEITKFEVLSKEDQTYTVDFGFKSLKQPAFTAEIAYFQPAKSFKVISVEKSDFFNTYQP